LVKKKKQLKKEAFEYGRRKKEMSEDCQSEQSVKAVWTID
jgi:hypothetical protein